MNREAQKDFDLFLKEIGMSKEQADAIALNLDDISDQRGYNIDEIKICTSAIHGVGVHSLRDLPSGHLVGTARHKYTRTALGRFTNHSPNYNIIPAVHVATQQIHFITCNPVKAGDEILVDYRQARQMAKALDEVMKL